ncbi:MAG: acyltransferase family protein [Deltaproteobacteria bacterium]|nr:acyltransferase family protein [Deltaproteobacteria bacterium]
MAQAERRLAGARIGALDALRGIAATSVVFYHYAFRFDGLYAYDSKLPVLFSRGDLGVDLFFIISGYLIYMTIERAKRRLDFPVSRFSRLYPAYWFCLALTLGAMSWAALPGRSPGGLAQVLANLTMFNGFFKIPYVDGVYWTLRVELAFYLMIYILSLLGQVGKIRRWLVLWLLGQAVYYLGMLDGLPGGPFAAQMLVLPFAALFAAGVCFYRIHHGDRGWPTLVLLGSCVVARCLHAPLADLPLVVGIFALFALLVVDRLRWLAWPPLLFLGAISYPLYLLHQNLGYIVIRRALFAGWPMPLAMGSAVMLVILAAWWVHRLVEMPGQKWFRALYRGWQDDGRLSLSAAFSAAVSLIRPHRRALIAVTLLLGVAAVFVVHLPAAPAVASQAARVRLIGDSVALGYADPLQRRLAPTAALSHAGLVARDTAWGLARLELLLGADRPDLVVANFGLWDIRRRGRTPLAQYQANLEQLILRLKSRAAQVVWVTTTPVSKTQRLRDPADVARYNAVARQLMGRLGVPVIDLHSVIAAQPERFLASDGVHLNGDGARRATALIAAQVGRYLPAR